MKGNFLRPARLRVCAVAPPNVSRNTAWTVTSLLCLKCVLSSPLEFSRIFPPPSFALSCWHLVITVQEYFYLRCQLCGDSGLHHLELKLVLGCMVWAQGSTMCLINGFSMNILLQQKYVLICLMIKDSWYLPDQRMKHPKFGNARCYSCR